MCLCIDITKNAPYKCIDSYLNPMENIYIHTHENLCVHSNSREATVLKFRANSHNAPVISLNKQSWEVWLGPGPLRSLWLKDVSLGLCWTQATAIQKNSNGLALVSLFIGSEIIGFHQIFFHSGPLCWNLMVFLCQLQTNRTGWVSKFSIIPLLTTIQVRMH